MSNESANHEWSKKNGTLSDKTARKEFGLTENEIIKAINDGKLQYRENNVFGNPYFRLLRSEVEEYVSEKYGAKHLDISSHKNELAQINKEIRSMKRKLSMLEKRKEELSKPDIDS